MFLQEGIKDEDFGFMADSLFQFKQLKVASFLFYIEGQFGTM